jgi:hypothetical protein
MVNYWNQRLRDGTLGTIKTYYDTHHRFWVAVLYNTAGVVVDQASNDASKELAVLELKGKSK